MRRLGLLAAMVTIAGGACAHARDFRSSDIYPPDSPTVEAVNQMGKLIELRTQGRHRIVTLGEADGDSEGYTIAQVRNGALDMARISSQAFNTSVPSTALLAAPFLFRSSAQLQRVLAGPIGQQILADLEALGLVGLCFYDVGARSVYSVEKPIRTVADVKGLRLRSEPGDIAAIFWRSFGAATVPIPYGKIADALRAKAIDAASGNWLAYASSGHFKAARLFSPTEHARPPGIVIFSKQVWLTLSQQDRDIVKGAARESVAFAHGRLAEYEAAARRAVTRDGVRIVDDIDIKSFSEPMAALYPTLFPEPRQQELLKRIQAAAGGT
jgi:TRAP-type C4-dicarboxylate transport system substrate-binding protein